MTLSRRAREILLVLGLLMLPALILRASVKAPDSLNPLDRLVLRLTAPLQGGLVRVFSGGVDLWRHYLALVDIKQKNEALLKENQALRSELQALSLRTQRGDRLERLLDLRNELTAETAAARVIGIETSHYRVMRVRVDRGRDDVKAGMPVLAPGGVVGRISRTFGPYSDVLLAVDPRSSIDVLLPRVGSRGVLKGSTTDDGYRCRIDYLLRQDAVQVGDLVVTSGLGSIFPADITVGKVAAIKKQAFGLYQDVQVEPAVDFGKLREVLILLAPPPPPDPDAGKRPADEARGFGVPR